MKTFKERAEELSLSCKRVKGNNVYETLAKEFNISKRTAGDRFKSIFQMPVRDFISRNIIPTKEQIVDYLIKSDDWNEFYKLTGINDTKRLVSLLNEYFGYSNYYKIKTNLLARVLVPNYNPTREDNESIIISQILGDGSVERDSGLKIEHGYKQYEYLKFKVGLLNVAYPRTNGIENIRKRTQTTKTGEEYVSFVYRTRQVLSSQIAKLKSRTLRELINSMTPFGIAIYYLDDGCLSKSKTHNTACLEFCTSDVDVQACLIEYFRSYGYEFARTSTSIKIQSKPVIIKFIKDFLEPYAHIIPKCMHYKFELKDIVGSCELDFAT